MIDFIKNLPDDLPSLHHDLCLYIYNMNLFIEPIVDVNVTIFRPNCLNTNLVVDFGTDISDGF